MTWRSSQTITARCRTRPLSWGPHQQGQGSRSTGRRPSWWRWTQLPTHQSHLVDSPSGRWSLSSTLEAWLTNREAQAETSQPELARQELLSSCSKTSGNLEESIWEPNSASSAPTWSQSCSTDVRHGGQHRRCKKRSKHSSTPVWGASTKSNGKRRTEMKICGSERDRNQWLSRYCRWSGSGSDTPSGSQHPAPHAKPWPGIRRGREREVSLATVGGETLKQSWNSKGPTGPEWPEQPRTECDGEFPVSAQEGIVALGKAHTRSAPSLSSLPKVALETVPIFAWLNTDRCRPWRVECRPLPFSTPLSFRRSMLWCSGLSVLRKFLKPRSTSALPSCRPDVISAVLASLSVRSFPLTTGCPGQ